MRNIVGRRARGGAPVHRLLGEVRADAAPSFAAAAAVEGFSEGVGDAVRRWSGVPDLWRMLCCPS
jgi:hypothetical protein